MIMTATQQVGLSVAVTDKKGNPAQVQDPVWATDNSDLLTLEVAADGMSCTVKATGVLGAGTVQFTCDADLGDGVSPLIGTVAFEITAGAATVVTITEGTPTEQP